MEQSPLCITFPVCTGGQTGTLLKGICEIVCIIESYIIGNLGNTVIRIRQLGFGDVHFALNHKLF